MMRQSVRPETGGLAVACNSLHLRLLPIVGVLLALGAAPQAELARLLGLTG